VGVAHILVFDNTQCLFCDSAMEEVLVHQGHTISEKGHQFIHQVSGVPEDCASEGSMQQVDSNVLNLFCNFDMDGFDNLAFGLTWERGCCRGSPSGWSEGFRGFYIHARWSCNGSPEQLGAFGFRWQRRPSNTSVRCQRLVCS